MNVLFLTMLKISSFEERGIYTDLLREFLKNGHEVFVVSPLERREKAKAKVIKHNKSKILQVPTLNLQKTSKIEKGIGQVLLEYQYLKAIKREFLNEKFDLVLYSTPPITFNKIISYVKNRDNAYSYLLLKDIFPQNTIDMKMMKKDGLLHRFFLKKEKEMYDLSDSIGCMSKANLKYIIQNYNINSDKVEVNPNSIEPANMDMSKEEVKFIREKYNLPLTQKIFIYGGNLGKPQGLDFLLETINTTSDLDCFYLVVGSGTEFSRIKKWFKVNAPKNAVIMQGLSKQEYDKLLMACDVGMIFLHKDFTIPNFPSRLLSYLEMKKPVITATDDSTDIGKVVEDAGCGKAVISGDISQMRLAIQWLLDNEEKFKEMKENAFYLLNNQYLVNKTYKLIVGKAMPVIK